MEFLKEIKLVFKTLQLQLDPGKTDLIFDVVDIAQTLKKNQAAIEKIEIEVLKSPIFKKMWETKWLPKQISLKQLKAYPPNSLGYAYLKHLETNKLRPDFYRLPKIKRVINYLASRLYSVHDIWHTLLGYDTSVVGELEVQAFTFAQLGSLMSMFIMAGGLYRLLRTSPDTARGAFERVFKAYERGKKARFLLDFPLEEQLTDDLETKRSELGI